MVSICWSALLASFFTMTLAEYNCLCVYNIKVAVYPRPQIMNLSDLGTIYDDCKPTYRIATADHNWQAIQFEKQIGYVKLAEQIQVQTCPGNPDPSDIVTSSVPATIRTTLTSTTTTSPSIRQTGISVTKAPSTTFTTKVHPNCQTKVPLSENLREFANHCYEFILGVHKMWPDAELDCNQRGGHLASISNLSEQNFIYHSLRGLHFHGDKGVWIGLTDQDIEGQWRWSSGESTAFRYWDHIPQGQFTDYKDCAMMLMGKHGHWVQHSCTGFLFNPEQHGYVCEYGMI